MDSLDRLRKYEPDKIALLAFFAVGLLIAYLITATKYTWPAGAGAKIIQNIKQQGLSSFLDDEDNQSFFIIKNDEEHAIGFAMSVQDDANDFSDFRINSASIVYIAGRSGQEQITYFRCDESFDEFNWRTEIVGPVGRIGMNVTGNHDGTIIIDNSTSRTQQSFKLETAAVPNQLLDVVFTELLQSRYRSIIIDIIESDGKVSTATIRKIRRTVGENNRHQTTTVLEVNLLDNRQYSQIVYFDDQGEILRIMLKREQIYILDRSDPEEVRRLFPDRVNQFLRRQ
jgi:hypothetical protein